MFVEQMDNAIYVISHNVEEQPQQKDYSIHSHNRCEMLLFLSGDADFIIDGAQYRLKPYDLILVPRRAPHYLIVNSTARYENYVIQFYETLFYMKHKERLFQPPAVFNIENEHEMLEIFGRFDRLREAYDKEDFHRVAECLTQELITQCCYMERIPARNENAGNLLIPNVLRYINTHLEDPLDADLLSREFNVSRSHLQNVFSAEVKTGMKQYIMQRKILEAHTAIAEGLSPGDAADRFGFKEYSTFYRLYKKTFGSAPSAGVKKKRRS